jgi:hypothetical protein
MKNRSLNATRTLIALSLLVGTSHIDVISRTDAQAGPVIAVAGALLGAREIAEDAMRSANETVRNAGQMLAANLDTLDKILGNNINKPLGDLDKTLRLAVEEVLSSQKLLEHTLDAVSQCTAHEVSFMTESLQLTLDRAIDRGLIISKRNPMPYVGFSHVAGTDSRLGLRVDGSPQVVVLEGFYPKIDKAIQNTLSATLYDPDNNKTSLKILTTSEKKISVQVPSQQQPGIFTINIQYTYDPGFFRRKRSVSADAIISVAEKPEYTYNFSIQPRCDVKEFKDIQISQGYKNTHGSDSNQMAQLCPEPGWRRDSSSVGFTGSTKNTYTPLSGECQQAFYTVPGQGGFLGTGPNHYGQANIHMKEFRIGSVLGNIIKKESISVTGYQNSASNPMINPKDKPFNGSSQIAADCEWTISGSVEIGSDHYVFSGVTGEGSLMSSTTNGARLEFNSQTGDMVVTNPSNTCSDYVAE